MGKKRGDKRKKLDKKSITPEITQSDDKVNKLTALVRQKALVGLFLVLVSFGVYSPSLKNDFVWDDVEFIKLRSYETITLSILAQMIAEPLREFKIKSRHFRPILYSSWRIDREIWGNNPFGFHLSNVGFYAGSVLLFYLFTLLVLRGYGVNSTESTAFLSSLLFAFYPMHVEPVSFVAARADILCGIFLLLALICHILSFGKIIFLLLTILSFYFSLLTKEIAVTFPLIVLVLDLTSKRFLNRINILRYSVYCGMFIAYFYMRAERLFGLREALNLGSDWFGNIIARINFASLSFATDAINNSPPFSSQVTENLSVFFNAYLFYILKLVFPFNLNPFISKVPEGSYYTAISIIVIIMLVVIAVVSISKKKGLIAFSIFWILANLGIPVIVAVFPLVVTPVSERFLYIPSIGYCLLIGYLILEAGRRFRVERLSWAFGFVLALAYLLITVDGQKMWKTNLSLWERATKTSPLHPISHINYGQALTEAGRNDQAIKHYLKVFDPRIGATNKAKAMAANNLGIAYLGMGEIEESERWFRKSMEYDKRYGRNFYYHMGYIYFLKGLNSSKIDENAEDYYRESERYLNELIKNYRADGQDYLLLANVYLRLGDKHKAVELAKKALQKGLNEPFLKQAQRIIESNR